MLVLSLFIDLYIWTLHHFYI